MLVPPLHLPLYTQVLGTARRMLAEILSAAEFLDAACMRTVESQLEGVTNPLEGGGQQSEGAQPFYMLIETHGSNEGHDVEKLDAFLEVGPPSRVCVWEWRERERGGGRGGEGARIGNTPTVRGDSRWPDGRLLLCLNHDDSSHMVLCLLI